MSASVLKEDDDLGPTGGVLPEESEGPAFGSWMQKAPSLLQHGHRFSWSLVKLQMRKSAGRAPDALPTLPSAEGTHSEEGLL